MIGDDRCMKLNFMHLSIDLHNLYIVGGYPEAQFVLALIVELLLLLERVVIVFFDPL